jgi:hypothetical protein
LTLRQPTQILEPALGTLPPCAIPPFQSGHRETMNILLLALVAFAVLFYRAAEYERMSPFVWGLASVALSLALIGVGGRLWLLIVGQVGLFLVMWWYNAFRARK